MSSWRSSPASEVSGSATRDALKSHFGFDSFLDNQEELVDRILQGDDSCVIMPTGAGKSLCYQLPILMRPGYGIVVSPLISLMKDQVDSLRERGIPAAFINSSLSLQEQQEAIADTASGRIKILYVAPERFQANSFHNLIENCPPSMLVVDEAHCISQWGHDFRPAYLRIGEEMETLAVKQVCAFTATATPKVRKDIVAQLHRPEMKIHVAGFKRPNLAFSVMECDSTDGKLDVLKRILSEPKPTIIYASTRKAVEEVAASLKCLAYHAGLSDDARRLAQDTFMDAPCPVLVATNAFGMGIDRPDVRRVIHYNIPGSLEAYYQEAGRAGRDGEPADCILLFSYSDRYIQEFLIDLNNPSEELLKDLYAALLREGRKTNSTTLEISPSELVEEVAGAKESQIYSALNILERQGYLERGYKQQNTGTLRFTRNVKELKIIHQTQATQRSRFIFRYIDRFGEDAAKPQDCSYLELAGIAGLNVDQIKRVLKALHGDVLSWDAPFGGRTTTLLQPERHSLEFDFDALRKKRDFEVERLDEVIAYTKTRGCRQNFLISYFGESERDWECGSCDRCESPTHGGLRKASPYETNVLRTIIAAVDSVDGRFGRGKISLMLAGASRPEIISCRLDQHEDFGALRALKQNNILLFIKALEKEECLIRTGNSEYPCLGVSARGYELINGEVEIKLEFPEIKQGGRASGEARQQERTSAGRSAKRSFKTDSLFDELRVLRLELAKKNHVPPYMILNDDTLHELVEKRPTTPDEALLIKGIGELKLKNVMPPFLDLLRSKGE